MSASQSESFEEVRRIEYAKLQELGQNAKLASGDVAFDQLMGLALSGGGIRSATFNLGVLQALAELELLKEFDYLSTVSGGGYIGSWLSAWIHRADIANRTQEETDGLNVHRPGVDTVQEQLAPKDGDEHEPPPVRLLRSYSNYLTPKTGLFSTDTLAAIATYLRNFILNLTVLVAALSVLLLIPRMVALAGLSARSHPVGTAILGVATLAVAIFFIELNLANQLPKSAFNRATGAAGGVTRPWYSESRWVVIGIVVPLVVSGLVLGHWLAAVADSIPSFSSLVGTGIGLAVLAVSTLIVAVFWWLSLKIADVIRHPGDRPSWRWRLLALLVGLIVGLGSVEAIVAVFRAMGTDLDAQIWHVTVWGPPGLLGAFGFAAVFIVGTSGREFEEDSREWWSRLGGILFGAAGAWVVLASVSIYAPWGVLALSITLKGLGFAWILTTLGGVRAAMSGTTGEPDSSGWTERLASVAPYVFVTGLLVLLAFGIHELLRVLSDESELTCSPQSVLAALDPEGDCSWANYAAQISRWQTTRQLWFLPICAIALVVFFSWRIDVNLFSFHMFYRNRLVRAYLGASNPERRAHPFTGFDGNDSPNFADLVQRPYHLVNTALNITSGERLAWQERKAAAFMFSPLFCGYGIDDERGVSVPAYQHTSDFVSKVHGSLGLGLAMTISGAAASPNQGYHSTPAVAFLLTVFNVRLGWWMQNPRHADVWEQGGPTSGFRYLLAELLGSTDERTPFVYLSDGGHFDNLGLYELLKRRCRFIVVSDAGCDPKFQFEDLGNAIRKCAVDLGFSIDIDTRAIQPCAGTGHSRAHHAVGHIRYGAKDGGGADDGYLVYIKPSLDGTEPLDVLQYQMAHGDFPHESTSDQWFAESQFESYRKLGYTIARAVFGNARVGAGWSRATMFEGLKGR